ncbi:hypothetical protein FDP41_009780 [Naegleria fowleri]|uniref:Uncharacterized protein n=1 Tax=Naegleria fowleri TaxID=5763 RepID=A0A6A5BDE6_NAEFO|nr:uncharacterized protein FDP41_009780 [Naegleria fowleri]KAF0972084.1 hypothetical protein FDP41_009780 [Naegleria fowleri]
MPSNKQSFLVSLVLVVVLVLAQLLIHVNSQSAPTPTYTISLLAGTGQLGHVDGPGSIAQIRKVNGKTGIISTVAGNGVKGYNGVFTQATQTGIAPFGLLLSPSGNIYFSDSLNNRQTCKIELQESMEPLE